MKRIWLMGLVLVLVMGPSSVSWARPVSRYVVAMQSVTGGVVVGFTDTTVTSVEVFVGCERWSAISATGVADVSGHNQLAIDLVLDGSYSNCQGQVSAFTDLQFTMVGTPMGQTSRSRNSDGSRTLVTSMSLSTTFQPRGADGGNGQLTEVISR